MTTEIIRASTAQMGAGQWGDCHAPKSASLPAMPDAFGNPQVGEADKRKRSGRRLTLVALLGAAVAAIAAYAAGGVETLLGGLVVFAIALAGLRFLIGAHGREMLFEIVGQLLLYAIAAVLFDWLFNGFGKLMGIFSRLVSP
jgi:hypothetical protein